jgi:hypothetical protein
LTVEEASDVSCDSPDGLDDASSAPSVGHTIDTAGEPN